VSGCHHIACAVQWAVDATPCRLAEPLEFVAQEVLSAVWLAFVLHVFRCLPYFCTTLVDMEVRVRAGMGEHGANVPRRATGPGRHCHHVLMVIGPCYITAMVVCVFERVQWRWARNSSLARAYTRAGSSRRRARAACSGSPASAPGNEQRRFSNSNTDQRRFGLRRLATNSDAGGLATRTERYRSWACKHQTISAVCSARTRCYKPTLEQSTPSVRHAGCGAPLQVLPLVPQVLPQVLPLVRSGGGGAPRGACGRPW
jgi:hypothetical protein